MVYTSREVYEYISKQTGDPIVEWKTCAVSGTQFPIYESDYNFYNKISPTFDGVKLQIPTPTLCPEERQRRRLMFRNERKLYRRTCDFSGKEIISMYSPDKDLKVYDVAIWRSDQRDAKDYGRDFDFAKSFTEQFGELMSAVPKFNLSNDNNSENSSYVNETTYQKNCYLTFDADQDEDCMYANSIKFSKDCIDCTNVYYCEHAYQLINCTKCYDCVYCVECEMSQFLISCVRCKDCQYCFECDNLAGKKYWFRNQDCKSREEYMKKIEEVVGYNYLKGNSIQRSTYKIQDEGSFGNNLAFTKNCILSYNFGNCVDVKYSTCLNDTKNSMDYDIWGLGAEYIYEGVTVGENAYHLLFNVMCWGNTKNLLYCYHCAGCSDCFGCVGLKNQSYCIFNKQYTSKEKYEEEIERIIRHMQSTGERGEFFDTSLSPFGYNETLAQEYFPIDHGQTKKKGYKRQTNNYDPKVPENVKVIKPQDYTQEQWIQLKSDNEVIKQIVVCPESQRPFRILKQELDFYRKHNLDLPKFHPDVRHEQRTKLKPDRTLYLRTCDVCHAEMLTIYPQDYDGKVYCEECYKQEVYG